MHKAVFYNADKLNLRYYAKEYFFMAKVDSIVSSLQKLYAKRGALDKQIVDVQKKLAAEIKGAGKPAAKRGAKKATAKRAPRTAAKK